MVFMKKCSRFFGWLLIVLGGISGVSSAVCALVALFGGMELDSFGERLIFFATDLMMTAAFFTILWLGIRLKNSGRGEKTAPPVKRKSSPANQKETQKSTDERRLQREKEEILRAKRTAYAGKITVQDALNTFPAEEQQRFENRRYQYSQDTGRGGLSPEIAAANRGMVFVDGRPVAKEVAARLDEMRNCAAVLLTDDYSDPIWIYEPTPGRPDGNIEVLKHLSTTENREDVAFDFEKTLAKRDVVKGGNQIYLRVTNYQCYAEANGRPVYTFTEDYHLTDASMIPLLTAESGLRFAIKSAAYRYEERGTGVLF